MDTPLILSVCDTTNCSYVQVFRGIFHRVITSGRGAGGNLRDTVENFEQHDSAQPDQTQHGVMRVFQLIQL